MIVRERAFGPCGGRTSGPSRRDYKRIQQKNGGNFWILRDRWKRISERPEKVHFWKIHFQNLFQKSKNSNFAAIFVYIEYMNWSRIIVKRYYEM